MTSRSELSNVTIAGYGLHTGQPSRIVLRREPGPMRLRSQGVEATRAELVFDGARRSSSAKSSDGRLCVRTVEHLFAAFGALRIHDGVVIEVDGPEIPLVDGGARTFVAAVAELELGSVPPPLRITQQGTITVGSSRYELLPPARDDQVELTVEIDFADERLVPHASWAGDPHDFAARIAPARTFGFEHEIEPLLAQGLARHVSPESVVLVARGSILYAGRPFEADEPARHKLLDLVGDLYAHGGPPVGCVRATRPGHAATHEAVRRALADGWITRTSA